MNATPKYQRAETELARTVALLDTIAPYDAIARKAVACALEFKALCEEKSREPAPRDPQGVDRQNDTTKMFFYGVLRPSAGTNFTRIVPERVAWEEAKTVQMYAMSAGTIPYASESPKTSHIAGELVDVPTRYLRDIDALWAPALNDYVRRTVDVVTRSGNVESAWMYFYQPGCQGVDVGKM